MTLPEGYDMVSLNVSIPPDAADFFKRGCRMNLKVAVRFGDEIHTFSLLENVVVVDVSWSPVGNNGGQRPDAFSTTFGVNQKEALVLSLAKRRGCSVELAVPGPNGVQSLLHDIDATMKILSEFPAEVAPAPRPVGEPR